METQSLTSGEDDGDDETTEKNYDLLPYDSNQLDDFEFQVFVALKKWRLEQSRELDIEPYKICQNRTLAELIRRKRNNLTWASLSKNEKEKEDDLLECWGIGPSKAKKTGFGDLLIDLINQNNTFLDLLQNSKQHMEQLQNPPMNDPVDFAET
jgi:ribonuclease D